MGRLVKHPGSVPNAAVVDSMSLPGGDTAERPNPASGGTTRYNTDIDAIEYWNDTEWKTIGTSGLVPIAKDTFTGNAALTVFTMSELVVTATDIMVYIGGVFQNPTVGYTVDGSTNITFTSPPPQGETVLVLHGYNKVI